jgi:hypothetical protein
MLKALIQKVWWVAIGLVIIGAVILVAHQEHTAAQEYERDREARCAVIYPSSVQQDACKHERDSPASYLRWWYILLVWPDGITTWAIIATGFVIAWQSIETRKAAEISRKALIAEFRPTVIVRKIVIDPCAVIYFDRRGDEAEWKISLHLHNAGGTVAHVHKYSTWLHLFHAVSGGTKSLVGGLGEDAPFDIPAGGNHVVDLKPDCRKFRAMLVAIGAARENGQEADYFVYIGTISYADDNGTTRDTGFYRIWMGNQNQFFVPAKDPGLEYQD